MRFFIGLIVGGLLSAIIWIPYGIYYTVEANSASGLVKFISTLKGLLTL